MADDPDLDRAGGVADEADIFHAPPAATSGAVTARNASPAPTVSTTVLVKAGTRDDGRCRAEDDSSRAGHG